MGVLLGEYQPWREIQSPAHRTSKPEFETLGTLCGLPSALLPSRRSGEELEGESAMGISAPPPSLPHCGPSTGLSRPRSPRTSLYSETHLLSVWLPSSPFIFKSKVGRWRSGKPRVPEALRAGVEGCGGSSAVFAPFLLSSGEGHSPCPKII